MDPQLERDLHLHIDAILKDLRGWASATQPINILTLAFYNMGAEHTRCTSGPFPLSNFFSSLTAFNSLFLAYIQVEQLKLQRSMGKDAFKSTMESRMIRRMGGDALPEGDPEPFDEFTGPTPCHPAD